MSESIFSKIIQRKAPASILFENDKFIVIANKDPKAPVHLLIIPKHPYRNLEEVALTDQDFHAEILILCRRMAKKMKIADNYQIHINVGKKMQQVQHLHIHLLGGWKNPEEIKQII